LKRIFFIRSLVERLRSPEPPRVSYRKTRKQGRYRVFSGGRFHPKDEGIIIEFYKTEEVDPRELTDEDARLAGIETAKELLGLFQKWYRGIPEKMYRNWFRVVKIENAPQNSPFSPISAVEVKKAFKR